MLYDFKSEDDLKTDNPFFNESKNDFEKKCSQSIPIEKNPEVAKDYINNNGTEYKAYKKSKKSKKIFKVKTYKNF